MSLSTSVASQVHERFLSRHPAQDSLRIFRVREFVLLRKSLDEHFLCDILRVLCALDEAVRRAVHGGVVFSYPVLESARCLLFVHAS